MKARVSIYTHRHHQRRLLHRHMRAQIHHKQRKSNNVYIYKRDMTRNKVRKVNFQIDYFLLLQSERYSYMRAHIRQRGRVMPLSHGIQRAGSQLEYIWAVVLPGIYILYAARNRLVWAQREKIKNKKTATTTLKEKSSTHTHITHSERSKWEVARRRVGWAAPSRQW